MLDFRGLQDLEQLDGREAGRPVARGKPRHAQVAQDAGEDGAPGRGAEHRLRQGQSRAQGAADQDLAVVAGEPPAAVGRVEEEPFRTADDEVPGQAHAVERQADAPRDLQLDDRQADRQPHPLVEDGVEQRVLRLRALAAGGGAEAGRPEEDQVDALHQAIDRGVCAGAGADQARQPVQLRERWSGLHVGTLRGRDQEGAAGEVDVAVWAGDQISE